MTSAIFWQKIAKNGQIRGEFQNFVTLSKNDMIVADSFLESIKYVPCTKKIFFAKNVK